MKITKEREDETKICMEIVSDNALIRTKDRLFELKSNLELEDIEPFCS
jgi:hypothetical protein